MKNTHTLELIRLFLSSDLTTTSTVSLFHSDHSLLSPSSCVCSVLPGAYSPWVASAARVTKTKARKQTTERVTGYWTDHLVRRTWLCYSYDNLIRILGGCVLFWFLLCGGPILFALLVFSMNTTSSVGHDIFFFIFDIFHFLFLSLSRNVYRAIRNQCVFLTYISNRFFHRSRSSTTSARANYYIVERCRLCVCSSHWTVLSTRRHPAQPVSVRADSSVRD